MNHPFWKYQGTGNDFILLNNSDKILNHDASLAKKICDRHFGIGSDGLIVIEPSLTSDFEMIFYNPDGSRSFCGNGSRCAVRFASDQGIISGKSTSFLSTDGLHSADFTGDFIELSMHSPGFIPCRYLEDQVETNQIRLINTGSPHLVLILGRGQALELTDVYFHGRRIRYSPEFVKEGVNVNFVSIENSGEISLRTYERGVEAETLSCGTGVTASAIVSHAVSPSPTEGTFCTRVNSIGGKLEVKFRFENGRYSEVKLCGPVEYVFRGEINI